MNKLIRYLEGKLIKATRWLLVALTVRFYSRFNPSLPYMQTHTVVTFNGQPYRFDYYVSPTEIDVEGDVITIHAKHHPTGRGTARCRLDIGLLGSSNCRYTRQCH